MSCKRVRLEDHYNMINKRVRLEKCEPNSFVILEDAFNCNLITYYHRNKKSEIIDIYLFLGNLRMAIIVILTNALKENEKSLKFNLVLECSYEKIILLEDKEEIETKDAEFKTKNVAVHNENDVKEAVNWAIEKLIKEEAEFKEKGSGWKIVSIDGLLLRINRFSALRGSSYIALPDVINRKKAVINVKNNDLYCFKWAILAKHVTSNHPERLDARYHALSNKYDFSMLRFPVSIDQIHKFERKNNLSVNVYVLKENKEVKPLKVCTEEKSNHFDLLYLKKEETSHYCYIKNFSRLVCNQLTKNGHGITVCKRCFTFYSNRDPSIIEKFINHKKRCVNHDPAHIKMPERDVDKNPPILSFKNYENMFPVPIVAYADFECILKPALYYPSSNLSTYTYTIQNHVPMSYCLYFVCDITLDEQIKEVVPNGPILYRGENAAQNFVMRMYGIMSNVAKKLKCYKPMNPLTNEEKNSFDAATHCQMCKKVFGFNSVTQKNVKKVRDHCHFTGRYRAALCNQCNLRRCIQNTIPVFIHNLANYDSHFILKELDYDRNNINVIPRSKEKYVMFTKKIDENLNVKYIDTFQFMASSLERLASNLPKHAFKNIKRFFREEDIELVTKKGVYPYEYTSSWEILEETSLPPIEKFYSTLTDSNISNEDYAHAKAVWNRFNCQNLGEYSDLYLKTDVLLLADVFENFRLLCLQEYSLDAAHYISAPGLAFDAMLLKTKVKLELITDVDMYMFIEQGIRGGITSVVKKHAVSNNRYYKETHNLNLPSKYVVYIDANNLYGYGMSQRLPRAKFQWVDQKNYEEILSKLLEHPNNTEIGYIFEVDVDYPTYLHTLHNELPFLPFNGKPPSSKTKKLLTTLEPKRNYVCHYTVLVQALLNGLKVTKIHKILQFEHSEWLKPYIELNTCNRQNAKNNFEKDFFKLMNNSVFGKSMENVRNRINFKLITCPKKLSKFIAKPTFVDRIIFKGNLTEEETNDPERIGLVGVKLAKDTVKLDKPIYVGLSILDISKELMYDFFYKVLKRKYGSKVTLCYMDTDSFILEIETDDFYRDMRDKDMVDNFDTSDYPKSHPNFSLKNKKVIGKFKDEANGSIITEYIGLRPKLYAWKSATAISNLTDTNNEVRKAKGVKKNVIKNKISFDDYKACLEDENFEIHRSMVMFMSRKHNLNTVVTNKKALVNFDDKRCAISNIDTLAWGHCDIPKELMQIYKGTSS